MSAWIVSETHVLTLAYFYEKIVKGSITEDQSIDLSLVKKTARILWNENIKSVNYRYNENNKRNFSRGLVLPDTRISYESLVKQINCWKYQSCVHSDFYKSKAYKMMMELKFEVMDRIVRESNVYKMAPWGL